MKTLHTIQSYTTSTQSFGLTFRDMLMSGRTQVQHFLAKISSQCSEHMSKNTQTRCCVFANTEDRRSMQLMQAIPTNLNNHGGLQAVTHASLPQHWTSPPKHNSFHVTLSTAKHNTLRPPAISNEVSSYQFHTETEQWTICPFPERRYLPYFLSPHTHRIYNNTHYFTNTIIFNNTQNFTELCVFTINCRTQTALCCTISSLLCRNVRPVCPCFVAQFKLETPCSFVDFYVTTKQNSKKKKKTTLHEPAAHRTQLQHLI
jgi:hypothetical protein